MDNNNNIEDFFNNSMDQFNDGPPDSVWDNIGNRLDNDKIPFYKGFKFWAILAVICLIGGFILYAVSTQKKINSLIEKTDVLELQNIEIESQLLDCGENSNRLINIINNYQTEKESKVIKQNIIAPSSPKKIEKVEVIPSTPIQEKKSENIGFINHYISPQAIQKNTTPQVVEKILPQELNDQIDSIIHNNPEVEKEDVKMIEVPIFSIDEDSVKSVEVEAIKPDIKGNMKDWFEEKKEKLETKKWKIFKKRNRNDED